MNSLSLNSLWAYLQSLSLTASNKKWLAEHLFEAAKEKTGEIGGKKKLQISEEDLILSQEVIEPVKDITPLPADFDFNQARADYLLQKYG